MHEDLEKSQINESQHSNANSDIIAENFDLRCKSNSIER